MHSESEAKHTSMAEKPRATPWRTLRDWWNSPTGIWAAPIAWMVVIFLLSSRSDFPNLTPYKPDLQNIIGHLTEYGLLTYLWARALETSRGLRHRSWIVLVIVMLYAASDEWHQTFVPGRYGDYRDWLVDVTAAVVVLLGLRWRRRQADRDPRPAPGPR